MDDGRQNLLYVIQKMSVVSRVKHFFAQTIAGYGKVMQVKNPDWHLVAKRMMYEFWVFNAEICDIPSDSEKVQVKAAEETSNYDLENE